MFDYVYDKKKLVIAGIVFLMLVLVEVFVIDYAISKRDVNDTIVINDLEIIDFGVDVPTGKHKMSVEEFEVFKTSDAGSSFESYEDYVTSESVVKVNTEINVNASSANKELYDISDEYFIVYYNNDRVSPIFPMALANVETPSRADNSKTWSALFPSKYVSTDLMRTFDITDVVTNSNIYKALSSEVSTRDRGALQMSPTYGTSNLEINKLMSGTEKDKLKSVDTSKCASWASGASSSPGDRFYLPDVLLRMRAASNLQISNMIKNDYQPETDMQLIAMLAMGHHSSGVWHFNNHGKSVGCWKSGELAFTYAKKLGNSEFVNTVKDYASNSDKLYIDSNVAKTIYYKVYPESFSTYSTKDIVCTYPIKVMYAYIKLSMLYTE